MVSAWAILPSSLNKMLPLIPVQIKWEFWYCSAEQIWRVGFKIWLEGSQLSAPVISDVSPQWKIRFRPCSLFTPPKSSFPRDGEGVSFL